jgi:hypothetical protein
MKGKLAVLAGFGAGYVLGTKAGRRRYEQIRDGAQRLWQEPHVATQRHKVAEAARDQAAAAKDAVAEKVAERVHHGGGAPQGTHSVPADELPDAPSYPV